MRRKCQKCGRILDSGDIAYHLSISIFADFDTADLAGDLNVDLQEVIQNLKEATKGLPAELIEEEVHKEFDFLLCTRCKEIFCANPLNLPLKGLKIPDSVPDPGDQ
jgi:hypothetical protein